MAMGLTRDDRALDRLSSIYHGASSGSERENMALIGMGMIGSRAAYDHVMRIYDQTSDENKR